MIEPDDERVREILGKQIDGLVPPRLVYVPGVGFRPATGGLRLRAPLTVERGGRTLTVRRLVSTELATELSFDVTGLDTPWQDAMRQVSTTLRDDAGHAYGPGRSWSSTMAIARGIRLTAAFEPLPSALRRVELIVAESGGQVSAWLDLEPLESSGLPMRRSVNASDTKHGVTLRVTGIAFSEKATVVDLEAVASSGIRWIRGIGAFMGIRRGPTKLTLRDDKGRAVVEDDPVLPPRDPTGRTDVAVFTTVAADAAAFDLEIEYIYAEESDGEASFTVPVKAPLDLRFGAHPVRVIATSIVGPDVSSSGTQDPARDLPGLRVDLDLGDWHDDRRLLQPGRVLIDGTDHGFRWIPTAGRGPTNAQQTNYVVVPMADPATARSVTLRCPTVHLRGPWRIHFERPS